MKIQRLCAFMLLLALMSAVYAGCASAESELDVGQMVSFRPVDCGIQSQEKYEYPFLGLNFMLSDAMLSKIDSREVFVYTQEDYTQDLEIAYGFLSFCTTTQEQRQQEGMSVDIVAWQESLEKIGAIGVYRKDATARLDELTACDTHKKIGESDDGVYEYYISANSTVDQTLTTELEKTEVSIATMHALDLELGYGAFSTDRFEGVDTVGSFATEDVFGNAYDETVFQEYDLTLVNVFATWCSPCVEEIPELEKLRQEYAEKGVKLGVLAVVLDTRTEQGTDEDALARARTLYERSGAQFPFLMPDDGNMNGRLTGIESVPESFFVDASGRIASEPYIGAKSLEEWRQIADAELAALEENAR